MGADDVTLLICTRDRADRLLRLLDSAAQLSPPPREILVIDNGSSDATPRHLADFGGRPAGLGVRRSRLRWYCEPQAGLGRARQRGLQEVRTSLVACTDDDCLLDPGHIGAVAAAFDRLDVGFVGGRILPAPGAQARVALLEDDLPRVFEPGQVLWPGAVQGANLAFDVASLRAVGGFRVGWGAGTAFRAEDVDAAARLLASGRRGAYCPEIAVVHDHGRDRAAGVALEAANARARGAFVASRLFAGEPAYVASWAARSLGRLGRRPRHLARAAREASSELAGAAAWLRAGRP